MRMPKAVSPACWSPPAIAAAAWLICGGCDRQRTPEPRVQPESPLATTAAQNPASDPFKLRDVTGQTGIAFVHTDGSSGQRYIVETVSAGLAEFDYDGDGRVDIYFLNGAPLRGTEPSGAAPPRNALYRNASDWRFLDVTEHAGVGDTGYGLGVTAGDYDNDGASDLFVSNYGLNVLYRNNGDGTFSDVTAVAGVGGAATVGAGACFLDMDADGDLDLYVANYVQFTYENHRVVHMDGYPQYVGPREYEPEPDLLYRNNGDGTFSDVSLDSGVSKHAGTGMGIVGADFDQDGDTDVFVLNDVASNFLFRNDGSGRFEEVGLVSGFACNGRGDELGSMGIDCGDYDNDGWLDFFMTSYQNELPVLYRNLGNGTLEDVTIRTAAGDGCFPYVNWGPGLVDLDNDGDRDLFVVCGHLQDNVELVDQTTGYKVRNVLLMNTGNGTFQNVSDAAGDGLRLERSGRGSGFDDLDGDGDLDVVILNSRDPPTILRNETGSPHHWLQISLRGRRANRDGVGSRVRVVAGNVTLVDEVHSGRGYQSHWGSRLQFGLGDRPRVDLIEVQWLGGGRQRLEDVGVDRCLTIVERSDK